MILANLRERFTATDVDLVFRLLARGDHGRERRLAELAERDGVDTLLDEPGLPELLRRAPQLGSPSAPLFIYVCVRHALRANGIDDRRLSDYLGALIFEFGLRERAVRIAHHDDQIYRYLTDIVTDIEAASGRRSFLLRAHLGNYSLWLAGIFPDYITAKRERKGGPDLSYYDAMGARGYRLASDHRLAHQLDLADVYASAAEAFSAIRATLNRLALQWLWKQDDKE